MKAFFLIGFPLAAFLSLQVEATPVGVASDAIEVPVSEEAERLQ